MSAACRRSPTPSTTPFRSSAPPTSRCRTTTGATGGRQRSWECSRNVTLRHSGMVRRTRPGISRFRVRCFASPRNDDGPEISGTTEARDIRTSATEPLGEQLFQDPPLDVLVGEGSIVPPPAVALHLVGRRDKAIGHFAEIRLGVVEAEYQPAGAD